MIPPTPTAPPPSRITSAAVRALSLALVLSAALPSVCAAAQRAPVLKRGYDTEGPAVLAAFAPVVAEARASVVVLKLDRKTVALGTVVTADGLVLTKASEVRREGQLTAELSDGRHVTAERLAESRHHDVALLRLDAQALTPIVFNADGQAAAGRLGQWVVVPGLGELPLAIGVYSAAPRRVDGVRLGIGMNSESGATIVAVHPQMGAAEAGLEPGDVLVSVAGQPVKTPQEVIELLRDTNAGDRLEVVVKREGKQQAFEVELKLPTLDPGRSRADRMNTMGNDVSQRRDGFASVLQHDATITPTECGGPLLDLDGHCLGINIARAGRIEAYTLPTAVVAEVLVELIEKAQAAEAKKMNARTGVQTKTERQAVGR